MRVNYGISRYRYSSAAPAPAAAVGFNTRTFGPGLTLGANWVPWPGATNVTAGLAQGPNNSLTITSPTNNTFNGQAASANGFPSWHGTVFGSGGYFEATLFWTGTYDLSLTTGWPAWWAVDLEFALNGNITNYIEPDFMEFWGETNYGPGIHNWYGTPAGSQNVSYTSPQGTGITASSAQKYGMLWVPATSGTQGYVQFYFNDAALSPQVTWNQYNPSILPPSNPYSVMDVHHFILALGTGQTTPMTVTAVSVWQASSAGNITQ